MNGNLSGFQPYGKDSHRGDDGQAFELDVLEAALIVATGNDSSHRSSIWTHIIEHIGDILLT